MLIFHPPTMIYDVADVLAITPICTISSNGLFDYYVEQIMLLSPYYFNHIDNRLFIQDQLFGTLPNYNISINDYM